MATPAASPPTIEQLRAIHPDVLKAEALCQRQRAHGLRYLKMNKARCTSAGDITMAERVIAAKGDAGEFENLITFPEVNALFCKGALFYQRSKK